MIGKDTTKHNLVYTTAKTCLYRLFISCGILCWNKVELGGMVQH